MNLQQAYINGFFKQAAAYGLSESEAVGLYQKYASALKGDQHKLDVDKDGKIEAEDLKKLRQRKQAADMQHPSTYGGDTPDSKIVKNVGAALGKVKQTAKGLIGNLGNTSGATADSRIFGNRNPNLNTPK